MPCAADIVPPLASDVVEQLSAKILLKDSDGWALFESTPDSEHFIRSTDYLLDFIAEWEADQRESMTATKYQTLSRKASFDKALGGNDAKFVFRKRLFKKPREIPQDPVEYSLIYAQAVHSITQVRDASLPYQWTMGAYILHIRWTNSL